MDERNNITKREKEILALIAEGKSNPEIAEALTISTHTVKAHIESIYRKLNVHNKVQAAVSAILYNHLPEYFVDREKFKESES